MRTHRNRAKHRKRAYRLGMLRAALQGGYSLGAYAQRHGLPVAEMRRVLDHEVSREIGRVAIVAVVATVLCLLALLAGA